MYIYNMLLQTVCLSLTGLNDSSEINDIIFGELSFQRYLLLLIFELNSLYC